VEVKYWELESLSPPKDCRSIHQAFRLRGIYPAGDQRGCSPPFGNPIRWCPQQTAGNLSPTSRIRGGQSG